MISIPSSGGRILYSNSSPASFVSTAASSPTMVIVSTESPSQLTEKPASASPVKVCFITTCWPFELIWKYRTTILSMSNPR